MLIRNLDCESAFQQMVNWTRSYVHNAGKEKLVLAMSGGLDSALVGAIAIDAVGSKNLHLVALPIESHPDSLNHALLQCNDWGVKLHIKDLTPVFNSFQSIVTPDTFNDPLARGNMKARIRMVYQYDLAMKQKALVIGTGNKSEEMVGYATKFGDNATDLFPIGNYYKTECFAIAKEYGVIPEILNKKPTADLWNGQTDEDEMGLTYGQLDNCLAWLLNEPAVSDEVITSDMIEKVKRMVCNSKHKNEPVPVCPRF